LTLDSDPTLDSAFQASLLDSILTCPPDGLWVVVALANEPTFDFTSFKLGDGAAPTLTLFIGISMPIVNISSHHLLGRIVGLYFHEEFHSLLLGSSAPGVVGVTGAEARRDAGRAVGAGLTPAAEGEKEKSTFKVPSTVHAMK
jgi:hypothetical protein